MQVLKQALVKSPKLDLQSLSRVLSIGLEQCHTEQEKKEFGITAMSLFDYENIEELEKYIHGEDGIGKYYRNLIFRDDSISLKNILWNPKVATPVHGHNCNGCWVICTQGELVERVYDNKNELPELVEEKVVRPGDITYIHDSIGLHQVENVSSTEPAVTLHCYHPPFDSAEMLNDEGELFKTHISYYSEYGHIADSILAKKD